MLHRLLLAVIKHHRRNDHHAGQWHHFPFRHMPSVRAHTDPLRTAEVANGERSARRLKVCFNVSQTTNQTMKHKVVKYKHTFIFRFT